MSSNESCASSDNYDDSESHFSSLPSKTTKTDSSAKIFCDPVHGQIALHPACVLIVDTPQFQRLRHIKQTGFLDYVYPGSIHNRFSHCLGVCYLAGKFVRELRDRQPELSISETEVLCLELAGLCHDLGHGPFSHFWESFMKSVAARNKKKANWKHEIVSINMLDYLIEDNGLTPVLKSYGIGEKEINMVKDFILGNPPMDETRTFLYQIVNNDTSGLDVDKWDYFLRDCHYLGLPSNFEYQRLIQFAKVFPVDGKNQIGFRDKVLENVYNVFRTRYNLHRLAYQHKVVIVMEQMFSDAIVLADGKCVGPSGEILQFWNWSMAAAYSTGDNLRKALENYCILTDSVVFSCIKFSTLPSMRKSVNIVRALEKRSKKDGFYQHIGLKILPYAVQEKDVLNGLDRFLSAAIQQVSKDNFGSEFSEKCSNPITTDDIYVRIIPVSWGKGERNPVESVHFYSKSATPISLSSSCYDVSAMLPKSFQEVQVHVICPRSDSYALQVLRLCFDMFWKSSSCNGSSHL